MYPGENKTKRTKLTFPSHFLKGGKKVYASGVAKTLKMIYL